MILVSLYYASSLFTSHVACHTYWSLSFFVPCYPKLPCLDGIPAYDNYICTFSVISSYVYDVSVSSCWNIFGRRRE
ncbi:hypothetical protein BDY19DRAFT_973529 [Irpex rosettiformis]|uniref:Uncharacterized protein n=1 Tax=Irpex rosettiformis TaxID=378272 RepID=A0ACB8TQA4_9APHY|nr:hypothetical protein BDY19DRAFT_973529 [Irpex rosettiformis]